MGDAPVSPPERRLLRILEHEYTPEIAERALVPLIEQSSPVSLRALDWTVVNWSRKHNVVCASLVKGQMTNIHNAYRSTLRFWRRRLFDPFRRRRRVQLRVHDRVYETTLGQANFALWAYRSGVLAYAMNPIHLAQIEADMNTSSKDQKRARKGGAGRKRRRQVQPQGGSCAAYWSYETVVFHG